MYVRFSSQDVKNHKIQGQSYCGCPCFFSQNPIRTVMHRLIPYLFVSLLLVLLPISIFCQSKSNGLHLMPVVGFRLHNNGGESVSPAGPRKILTSPVLGLELSHSKLPISFGYQRESNLAFWNYVPGYDEAWSSHQTWEEDQLQMYWRIKHFSLGVGHYWKKRENSGNHEIPGFFILKRKGVQLSFVYPTKWIDIEFRTKIQYDPDFAAIGNAMHSILFLYRIGKREEGEHESPPIITVNGIIGARVFRPEIKLIPGEEFNKPFGIAPGLGLEFLFEKINISMNLEKDWWLYLNGGSPTRDVRGLIFNSFIGAKYHHELKNGRHIRFGLGGSWIEDNDAKLKNVTLTPTPEQQKLGNFQVKGIGASLSYEILPNTDVELKTTIPIVAFQEKAFESTSRTSLGIFYRFNPLRKK
jgi:hypothetical protein